MKIALKKLCAVMLCISLFVGLFTVNVNAADTSQNSKAMNLLYDIGDLAIKGLWQVLSIVFPPIGIPSKFAENENFLPGMTKFQSVPATPSYTWKLGHSEANLLSGLDDAFIKKLCVSGALSPLGTRTVSEILDPPRAVVTALNDGTGRGTAVFVSLDAFGITSVDVGNIRAAVADFAKANNVISINVSALHQHSTIDTLGMNGNLVGGLFLNSIALLTGFYKPFSGKNPDYMKHLTNLTAAAIKNAVNGMEEGTLKYSKADVGQYINDKRVPITFDQYFHRLRFVPTNGASPETWLCEAAIHTTGMGTSGTQVTSDFPYFIGKAIKESTGANFQFIQGAQLAMGMKNITVSPEGATSYQRVEAYGRALADALINIPSVQEENVPALLNIAHKEYVVEVDNPLHMLMMRVGILESNGRKLNFFGTKMELKTELGYMEIGDKLAVAIIPGELEPAVAFGGGLSAAQSYTGKEYIYTPLNEMVGNRELIVFGLTNDQAGYMLLPNDIAHFVKFGNEEINASSKLLVPKTIEAFQALTEAVK